jgi:hypothetical protein
MSTIRETIENAYAAGAFAERGLTTEAKVLLKGENRQAVRKDSSVKQVENRPRPTLYAK